VLPGTRRRPDDAGEEYDGDGEDDDGGDETTTPTMAT
jgi:hypothetical protein